MLKEEGRRKKEEGRRKKEEGRRKKEEGRRNLRSTFDACAIRERFNRQGGFCIIKQCSSDGIRQMQAGMLAAFKFFILAPCQNNHHFRLFWFSSLNVPIASCGFLRDRAIEYLFS